MQYMGIWSKQQKTWLRNSTGPDQVEKLFHVPKNK